MVKGEKSFFLKPGEDLEDGIQDMYVLADDEGLVLKALEVKMKVTLATKNTLFVLCETIHTY